MKVYKNFLSKEDFKNIESVILSDEMPWYFNDNITRDKKDTFQFTYSFIIDGIQKCHSDMINLINPILSKLQFSKLNRIKANLTTRENKIKEYGLHTDQNEGMTGIFYMNNCNGYTKFEDGTIIKSEKNKYIEFDSKIKHTGSSCTDEKRRIVINFNYQ